MPCRGTGLTGAQDSVGAGHDGCGRPRTCSADRHLPRRSCSVYPSALHLRWTHPEHCIRALAVAEEPWPFRAGEGEPSWSTGGGRQSAGGREWGTAAPVGRLNGSGGGDVRPVRPVVARAHGLPLHQLPDRPSTDQLVRRALAEGARLLEELLPGGRAARSTGWGSRDMGVCSVRSSVVDRPHRRELSALRSRPVTALHSAPSEGAIVPPAPSRGTREALVSRLTRASPCGVSDGARTRDTQDHNLVLYQLSYTHHVSRTAARRRVVRRTGTTIPETLRRPMRPGVPARARRRPRPRTAPRRTP